MGWSSLRAHLAVVLIAVTATVAMTWPLAAHAATSVQDLGDPLLQIWTLKWDVHQLARAPWDLYQANTFTPFPLPLAYSESMLGLALPFALLHGLTGDDVLAYNLLVLFSFAASVVGAYALARQFTRWTPAALLAGLAFAFLPYRFGHLSHLNLLTLHWLPLTLLCLWRFLQTPRWGWAAGLVGFFLLQALSSFYYAYLTAIACAVLVLVWLPGRAGRDLLPRLGGLAAAALVVALVMTPVSLPYFAVRDTLDFQRDAADVDELAATPKSYLSVTPDSWLYRGRLPERYPNPLFPGFLVIALAAVGLVTARRRLALALALVGGLGVLLSFGISLNLAGREWPMPYALLYAYLPGARGLRDVARFGVLPLLALAVLAAAGLGWLCDRLAGGGRWRSWAAPGLALLACGVVLAELASASARVAPVARDAETLSAFRWLAGQPPGLVMDFPADGVRGDVTKPTRYMYYSSYHWQPMVLGYSGFVPPLHYEFVAHFPDDRRTATPSLLTPANVGLLHDLGVRYLLFHRFSYSGGGWRLVQENLARIDGLTHVGQFGPTWVYLLAPDATRRPVRAELLLPNRAVTDRPYLAHYALQNLNATVAAHALGGLADLTLTWQDVAGRSVGQADARLQPGAVLGTGTRLVPLDLGPPPPPGEYRVVLTSPDARLAALLPPGPTPVTVLPPDPPPAAAPPRLAAIAWGARAYRAGETLPVALTWAATGPLPGYTVFCQLIGPDNTVWAQRDGDPLDTRRPPATWLPGEQIPDRRDLPIRPDAPPGQYRLLVGLYNPATGQRLPIGGPDGGAGGPEVWSRPLTIAP